MADHPASGTPESDLAGFVTIGDPDLDCTFFVPGRDPDGLGAGGLDDDLVGFAVFVLANLFHGGDVAYFISCGLDLDLMSLKFIVSGFDQDLLGVCLVVAGHPLARTGATKAVGEAEAQAKGRTVMVSGGIGSSSLRMPGVSGSWRTARTS